MLLGKSILFNVYIGKEGWSKTNDLSFYFKKLEKEQIKSKVNSGKELMKIRAKGRELGGEVQDGGHMYIHGWFMSMYGKTTTIL